MKEKYPCSTVFISNLVAVAIYLLGGYLVNKFGGVWWTVGYLGYIAFLEIKLLRGHCVNCYYFGKVCAFGKGKLSSLFFKKGNPKKFVKKDVGWKDILPDFLVTIVPVVLGIILLVRGFSWVVLGVVMGLFILMSAGNGYVRGQLACKYCKQRKIGCPAEKMFKKK